MSDFIALKDNSKFKELTKLFTYYTISSPWRDANDLHSYASYDAALKAAINSDPYWQYHNIHRIHLYKNDGEKIFSKKEFICCIPSKNGKSTSEYIVLGVETESGINILKSAASSLELDNIDELKDAYPNLGIYKVKVSFDDNKNIKFDYSLLDSLKINKTEKDPKINIKK